MIFHMKPKAFKVVTLKLYPSSRATVRGSGEHCSVVPLGGYWGGPSDRGFSSLHPPVERVATRPKRKNFFLKFEGTRKNCGKFGKKSNGGDSTALSSLLLNPSSRIGVNSFQVIRGIHLA